MSYTDIADKLMERVSEEGEIENEMSNKLFASFNDPNVWSPFDIDCSMPESSFYIAKLNSELSPINVDAAGENVYLILRYTNDDITQYLDYIKMEYVSYLNMETQVKEIIAPIGYAPCISQKGFLFVFLTSTNITLDKAINSIKNLPLEKKFTYAIDMINIVDETLISSESISGFHITPKTILINLQNNEVSLGIIGFIGGNDVLKLCPTANKFLYIEAFSPPELKKGPGSRFKIRAPNSSSDVYSLAKVVQFMISDELEIPSYKNAMISATQKNQNDRILLKNFKDQILRAQKDATSLGKNASKDHLPKISKTSIAEKIIGLCTKLKTKEGCPQIYKLPQVVTKTYEKRKLRKVRVGQQVNSDKEEIKILIVGSTGSGKTTFLNGISNYLYGVQWLDNYRFKIVSEGDDCSKNAIHSQSVSQTDFVTAYTFYWQPDFPIPYTVTLIDTPGFGDTRGIEIDRRIVDQLESLFTNEGNCGIDSLNAVAFVVQASLPRLTPSQQYIFDSIQQLFGIDIGKNFVIIATYADAGELQILDSLKKADIQTDYVSKFNNSALFAKNNGDDVIINNLFWNIGYTGYKSVFANVAKMSRKNLKLTQDVLVQRRRLNNSIDNLNKKIREGISKMNEIEQECTIIEKYSLLIQANQNFTYTIEKPVTERKELNPGTYVTNCQKCNKTCHDDCSYKDDQEKINCCAMNSNGYCNNCGCHWTIHHNMPFKWITYYVTETQTDEDLKQKYGVSQSKKQSSEQMLEKAQNEYQQIWDQTSYYLSQCKDCVNRLHKIALKPISMSEIDYIQLQIETEKQNRQEKWQERIEWLNEILEQHKLIAKISKGENIMPQQITQAKNKRIIDFLKKIIRRQ